MRHSATILILLVLFNISCSNDSNTSSDNTVKDEVRSKFIQQPVVNAQPLGRRILVLGDSLAYGFGANSSYSTPSNCLSRYYTKSVENFSVPGKTSSEVLNEQVSKIGVFPGVVFVSSGGNDLLINAQNFGAYPVKKSLSDMEAIFANLHQSGALVVYLGLFPPFGGDKRLEKIAQLAASSGVLVLDGMDGFWENSTYMSDKIHPNDLGYQIMCDRLIKALSPYFRK